VEVRGNVVTLKVGGVAKVSHTFGSAVSGGLLGIGVENGQAIFDDLVASSSFIQ
jgi:hypothetical protein